MAFLESNGVITQSLTDNDLSGLSGITGVTTTVDNGITTYDVASTHRLIVTGTLFHDPETEVLILRHDHVTGNQPALFIEILNNHPDTGGWKSVTGVSRDSVTNRLVLTIPAHGLYSVGEAVKYQVTEAGAEALHNGIFPITDVTSDTITLGMTEYSDYTPQNTGVTNRVQRRAIYHYGREITDYGNTRLSTGCGLFITGTGINSFQEDGAGLRARGDGIFRGRGGIINSSRCFAGGIVDIVDTEFVSPTLLDTRTINGGVIVNWGLVNNQFAGIDAGNLLYQQYNLKQGSLMETLSQSYYEVVLKDLDTTNNTGVNDIGHSTNPTYPHRDWVVVNSAKGSSVRGMWRTSTGQFGDTQMGVVVVKKEVSFNFKDGSGSAISGAKLYLTDSPSPYAKNATFPAPTDPLRQYTNVLGTNTEGVLNGDGTATYDYTNPLTYTATSDSNGDIDTLRVTTGVQILEYSTNDPSASSQGGNGGPYDIPLDINNNWSDPTTGRPTNADWDSDKFDGFYKVDRRGNGNTAADLFTFKFCAYNYALSQSTQALKGLGELEVDWILFADPSITETNKGTVDAYTTIDNPEQFYDRAKSFLYDNYAGETSTIVSRSGNTINAGSYNITVDANAASVFAFDGTTITIKATQFIGNITSSGTFSLLNDAEILGSYGAETVLPWTVTNVEAGSTIQLFNVTGDNEIENYITAGSGTKITATGSYGTADAVVGDTIRLRVTCQVGLEALEPFETFGVATAAGIAFRADQVADTIYNANNIDGSNITGIALTPDYTNIQIDLDDDEAPYQITAQEIYNFYAYIITTVEGIANFFGAISPIDRMNYRINASIAPIKIQNTGTTDVVINGGRLYRDDNVSIIDTNQATGAGTGSLVHDTGFLLQYIQPQVEAAVGTLAQDSDMQTVKTDVANIKKKTNLISGLV